MQWTQIIDVHNTARSDKDTQVKQQILHFSWTSSWWYSYFAQPIYFSTARIVLISLSNVVFRSNIHDIPYKYCAHLNCHWPWINWVMTDEKVCFTYFGWNLDDHPRKGNNLHILWCPCNFRYINICYIRETGDDGDDESMRKFVRLLFSAYNSAGEKIVSSGHWSTVFDHAVLDGLL